MGQTHRISLRAALALTLLLGGCNPWVNIPPTAGDAAAHDPNLKTVQEVAIVAARAALADNAPTEQFQVVLPKGTLPVTYDTTLPRISKLATWTPGGPREGAGVVEVRQIRIRGSRAEADVVRPMTFSDPDGYQQVVTAYMSWDPVSQWRADRVSVWRTSVERAMRRTPNAPVDEVAR